ncbi:ATP-binding protein [Nannocystis bainbridge]|uniref:histidine kinase n=1 Tax=Nannocystis bainbridge TaxID=2995303 RepID=A0ABT5DSK7_9BACT|nr:ATP-binding protein [Nannocystis bainbridge]MDC0716610.1 ATP-binding protein [Nannocystis bainbridge]
MEPVTLDTCASEPIHIPGAIQPHGVLLACRGAELVVQQVSANVGEHLAVTAQAARGASALALFEPGSADRLRAAAASEALREHNPLPLTARSGRSFEAVLHRVGDVLVVELEPRASAPGAAAPAPAFDPRLRASVLRLQAARDVAALTSIAAAEVRAITGFDRVMVYRFDPEWNGEVVAEDRRADLEPFLGQHYPASDIPAQARRLYTINWLRLIGDVDYRPVPLLPPLDPASGAPLDLSHGVLRSVSPIHIEYLRNMGVTASMSISLLVDGALAGLIACHHYSGPRVVPFQIRETAEFLAQALSWQLSVLERADEAEQARRAQVQEAAIVQSVVTHAEMLDGLGTPALLELVGATGAAVVLEEGFRCVGECPGADEVAALVAWLRTASDDVVVTDRLAVRFPGSVGFAGQPAGLLAVAVSRALGEYILWFRPSTEQTIDWAGGPAKTAVGASGDGPPRLSPRGSFALWRETVRGRSLPWQAAHIEAASSLRRVLLGGVRQRASELRTLNQRLLDTDRAKDNFIATVSHELRAPLNVISGWAQMMQEGFVPAVQVPHVIEVIARNAQLQTQIVDDLLDVSRMASGKLTLEVAELDLRAAVGAALETAALAIRAKELQLVRTFADAPLPVLGDETRLRQIAGNLVTNAVKFTPKGGTIHVDLRRVGDDAVVTVRDTGQGLAPAFVPFLFDAFRQADAGMNRRSQGLGLGLAIVRKLVELHGGQVHGQSEGEGRGATFTVQLPLATAGSREALPQVEKTAPPRPLAGLRCLLVEDEADSRELLQRVLELGGATVTAVASASAALAAAAAGGFAVMISDIGMPEQDGLQLMRTLRARPREQGGALPAIALTAYTRELDRVSALQAGFQAHIGKPIDAQALMELVAEVAGRRR